MNGPSRRAVLGSAGAIGLGTPLGPAVPVHAAESPGQGPALDTAPARSALNRILPKHADQFRLTLVTRLGTADRFRVTGTTGRIDVTGTSPAVLRTGVHWNLKYVCGAHLAWNGSRLDRAAWFASYADFRYGGGPDDSARRAWRALHDTAYQHRASGRSDAHDSLSPRHPGPTGGARGDHPTIRSFC